MAANLRRLTTLNFQLFRNHVNHRVFLNQARNLFSPVSLGLTAYNSARSNIKSQFINVEDSFRTKMQSYVDNEKSGMIFTEDLKIMLHLIENTQEDKDLIVKMLHKFNKQYGEMRFSSFTFGPIVMRAFHVLNEPLLALEVFKNSDFEAFFNQLSTYQILLDLLYINGYYKEMREVYDSIKVRLTDGRVHPRNALILVTAACYKENTPESYKYAMRLWSELDQRGYPTVRRVLTHLGALAVRQGQPHVALEILTSARKPRYIGIRCLKIMAYSDLDRVDDVVPYFRASLDNDDPNLRKEYYFKDSIEKLEAALERTKAREDSEIVKLLKLIKSSEMIQNETIDDHINTEVTVLPRGRLPDDQRQTGSDYRTHGTEHDVSGPKVLRRPGLRDLV